MGLDSRLSLCGPLAIRSGSRRCRSTTTSPTRTTSSNQSPISLSMELADGAGLEALTMRALGDSVGVEAMSLYNHVANKDDLLESIADLVVGRSSRWGWTRCSHYAGPWRFGRGRGDVALQPRRQQGRPPRINRRSRCR